MPTRLIRSELLTSEAWLQLKNNDDRVCWIVLVLNADNLGNQPAGPYRLIHIWRHVGIDTEQKVAKVLSELADVDLIRLYEVDDKRYCHIPRFGQNLRYIGTCFPISPWNTTEEKQRLEKKSRVNHGEPHAVHCEPPHDVDVDVDVDVDKNPKNKQKPPRTAGTARKRGTALPADFAISDRVREWARQKKHTRIEEHFEYFVGYAKAKDPRYVDWDQAFMNAIRSNWARLEDVNGQRMGRAAWWTSESATNAKAAELGITARAGESWQEFRQRISQAVRVE